MKLLYWTRYKQFFDNIFKIDLAFAYWRTISQQRNCNEMFAEFNRIYLKTLEKKAPTEMKSISNSKKLLRINLG